jgi:GTP pyrophosphokinase
MVAVRDSHLTNPEDFDAKIWTSSLALSAAEQAELFELYSQLASSAVADSALPECQKLLAYGVEMVEILMTMEMDMETLKVALLYPFFDAKRYDIEQVETLFGANLAQLLIAVVEMDAIRTLQAKSQKPSETQVDNLRRMLMAIVDDVRVIVIKLAERICHLRDVKNASEEERVLAAKEISDIYAPLANRLGIGQLKWELEDLSFRYSHPKTYKKIAKLLHERRIDREEFIDSFVRQIKQGIEATGAKIEVYGRPKHIYSIWKKMQKKNLDFSGLYDVRAVRVIAAELQDCYAALGVIHTLYRPIPSEFDDYVANPKANGYQSIHTVVTVGDEKKPVEIQIRTKQMHDDAELGVAAHWRYKEGSDTSKKGSHEEKIAWLRKLLAWQDDMAESGNLVDELRSQVFDDRVYVFTPKGDVVDMPQGATPLDFAYYVHSMVGHRCIGAKISGRIVPFTYELQTGDQIEIITQKNPNPSRDWLLPNLGYVKSARARGKITTYFKRLDRDKNVAAGKDLLEAELQKLGLHLADASCAFDRFNANTIDDLLAQVGSGDARLNQVLNHIKVKLLQPSAEEEDKLALELVDQQVQKSQNQAKKKRNKDHIVVEGVGNLMTHIAKCCQPIPGDEIVGYITQGRGISIHRQGCLQYAELSSRQPERVIDAVWGDDFTGGYRVTLVVHASDRSGLLRDLTTIFANDRIHVAGMNTRTDPKQQTATLEIHIELYNIDTLSHLLNRMGQVKGVIYAKRLR